MRISDVSEVEIKEIVLGMCVLQRKEKNPRFLNPHRRLPARESRPKHTASNRADSLLLTDQTTDWSAPVVQNTQHTASRSLSVTGVLAKEQEACPDEWEPRTERWRGE